MGDVNISLMAAQMAVDVEQTEQLKLHQRHIQAIWRHLGQLEDAVDVDSGEITLSVGDASITLHKDGTVRIKGKDITIEGRGRVKVNASGDLYLRGSKVLQN
jgi:hypothetical protein